MILYDILMRFVQALGKLEAVQNLSALDWRGTAEAAVRAALAGGAKECDVLVLRRGQAEDIVGTSAPEPPEPPETPPAGTDGGEGRPGGAWMGKGLGSKRFVGSVGLDGVVVLEKEGGFAVPARG